jgi:hypothetical protein
MVVLKRLRQEDHGFEDNVGYIIRTCLKKTMPTFYINIKYTHISILYLCMISIYIHDYICDMCAFIYIHIHIGIKILKL